jgi:hypothetical protein
MKIEKHINFVITLSKKEKEHASYEVMQELYPKYIKQALKKKTRQNVKFHVTHEIGEEIEITVTFFSILVYSYMESVCRAAWKEAVEEGQRLEHELVLKEKMSADVLVASLDWYKMPHYTGAHKFFSILKQLDEYANSKISLIKSWYEDKNYGLVICKYDELKEVEKIMNLLINHKPNDAVEKVRNIDIGHLGLDCMDFAYDEDFLNQFKIKVKY